MADGFSDERAYVRQHGLPVYFEDFIRHLLDARRRSAAPTQTKADVTVQLRDYFGQIKRESHVLGRDFTYIHSTQYNRRAFLGQVWLKCQTSVPMPSTLKDMHALMLCICPDFPYALLEASAMVLDERDPSATFDYILFLRAFQLCFLYDEFIAESRYLFRSYAHRLTCHVPTAEVTAPQSDYNQRQILLEALEKLIEAKTCPCPPVHILDEVIPSSDELFTHKKFLLQLVKNEKLTRFIGKEPSIVKQARPMLHSSQRTTIEPIIPIQNETKLTLTTLPARVPSPVAPTPLLPPLPKQQALTREKPIRHSSSTSAIASANLSKRVEPNASLLASVAKPIGVPLAATKRDVIETDSDIESRSSDTDT